MGENKDVNLKKSSDALSYSFNAVMQKEDLVNILNKLASSCCPIQFYYTKNDSGENVANGLVVTNEPQSCEIFAKAIMDITGIADIGLANKLCEIAANALSGDSIERMPVILQSLNDYKPRNAREAGLVCQATVLEMQGMKYLQRAESAVMLHHRESAINIATKLLRLQHETLETLSRLKRGSEQRVIVQHQHVQINEGGKAIVGS